MPQDTVDLEAILRQLTLEEKVSLVSACDWWRTPIVRRGEKVLIPHVKTTDGPNGARGESYVSGIKSACFPCGSSIGASFDITAAHRVGKEIALEARTKSANILLAPTVNVIRSPIGGRNHELFSEDPFLLGTIGAAYVNGCQSEGVAATPKHFVANDVEKRRRFLTAEMTEQTLREIYLYPFQLILKLADPWAWMTSYNRVNGTYVAHEPRLLDGVLRKEWGFKGLVMSDWVGTYSTDKDINAGLDLEMPGPTKLRGSKLIAAIKEDTVTVDTLEKSVMRVLRLVEQCGRFQDPESSEAAEFYAVNAERDAFIAQSAAESAVLLKNDGKILPLSKNLTVAMIGHHASIPSVMGGGSAKVDYARHVTPIAGLQAAGFDVTYEKGVPVFGAVPLPLLDILSPSVSGSPTTNPVKLEWFNKSEIGKNQVHEQHLTKSEYMIKERWPDFLAPEYCTRMTFNLTPRTTGEHLFSCMSTGKAIVYVNNEIVFVREQEQKLQREAFYFFRTKFERRFKYRLEGGKTYSIRIESWATEPDALARSIGGAVIQGTAFLFFEYTDISASIKAAADLAANRDVAVVCVGTTMEFESEGYDREHMDLTPNEYKLIDAVVAANPNTIVVNYSGSPVDVTRFYNKVAALVQAWFPGQECGHALAQVLSGEVNACGRLPMSWPRRLEDNPSFGNFPTDDNDIIRYEEGLFIGYRHYDLPHKPDALFPFGFGLSYTTFALSSTAVSGVIKAASDTITVSTTVSNTGTRDGKVVVQFYVQPPPVDGVVRPLKELKAFEKPFIAAGASIKLEATLDKYSVSYYSGDKGSWHGAQGIYKVLVGFSSVDIVETREFEVVEEFIWKGL